MSGSTFVTRIPIHHCGCGGNGIIWQRTDDLTCATTVEAFCSKHCGIRVTAHLMRDRSDGLKAVRTWNRAMGS